MQERVGRALGLLGLEQVEVALRLLLGVADGAEVAEASWTLATNSRINKQLEDMGGRRYKVWRLYKKDLT